MRLRTSATYKLLAFFLLFATLTAYPQSFTTRLYTTADGLSDNYIYCIFQDSYGYIWAGTTNGLNRFDGKHFTSYGLKQGLPSLSIDKIYEDHHHRLWIGTRSGIAELKGDSCYTYPVSDKQDIYFISSFLETAEGKLWVTTNKGLYELRGSTWVKIPLCPGYENVSIGKIVITHEGLFVNYNNNSVVQRSTDGKWKVLFSVESQYPYYNSLFQKNDTVYMGSYSGLRYWDKDKWVNRFEDTLGKKYVYISYADNHNRFWFGTKQDGVLVALPGEDKPVYLHIPLSFNLVSNFCEDRDQNIWVAGFKGLLKVSPSPYKTISLPGLEKGISIRNCIAQPSGNIVVSADNGKLLVVQPALLPGSKPQVIAIKQLKQSNDFIDFYTFDEKQRMWFTTRESFLYRMDGTEIKDMTSIISPPNFNLRGLAYDKKIKRLYVCGDSVFLAGNENHLDTFFMNKKFIRLPYTVSMEENKGSLLIETIEDGPLLVTEKGEITPLQQQVDISHSVQDTFPGKDGGTLIWTANKRKSISKYYWQAGHPPVLMDSITEKDDLTDNKILDIALDKEKKLWIATTKGVIITEKDKQQQWAHQDYEISESGTSVPLSFAKLSCDINGNMWMNLDDKLIQFNPKEATITPYHTGTVIEKVLLYDQPTDWSLFTDSLKNYLQLPIDPVLQYNQNSLSILFNSPQFSNNSLLEYSYRLLPGDTTWGDPIAGNIVSFYQLAPGNYHFEVISHIKGFDWSEPSVFSFRIRKPFWETWWFRIALIILASALIIFIFRYRLKQLKIKTGMKNQLLELEMKALKAQMNPHFIHNALNSIQSLILNNQSTEASRYISKFAKLLRQVFESADKDLISLDKELNSLQLYLDLERLRMSVDIEYEEKINENVFTSEIKIPPLILQPFVENALWHGLSRKEGHKKVILTIVWQNGWIICGITDNGIGRKKAAASYKTFPEGHLSKAVQITRQRLTDFNQSPGIEPVSFIDLEENGVATGTTVIIRIKAG
jgi:ligand-binding sensor domain-containing protein